MNKKTWLRQNGLFSSFTDEQLDSIQNKFIEKNFEEGEIIVQEGSHSDSMFILTSGIVRVQKHIINGDPKQIAILIPGDTIGEIGILDNDSRSATCLCLSTTETLQISRNDFLQVLKDFPVIGIELARILARHIRSMNRKSQIAGEENIVVFFHDSQQMKNIMELAFKVCERSDQELHKQVKLLKTNEKRIEVYDVSTSDQDFVLDEAYSEKTNFRNWKENEISFINLNIENLLEKNNFVLVYLSQEHTGDWNSLSEYGSLFIDFTSSHKSRSLKTKMDYVVVNTTPVDETEFRFIVPKETEKHDQESFVNYILDLISKNRKIGIYIPTLSKHGESLPYHQSIDDSMQFMGKLFGGATCVEARGIWKTQDELLVDEKVFQVLSYTSSKALTDHVNGVISYAKNLKDNLEQDAIAVEIDGKLSII